MRPLTPFNIAPRQPDSATVLLLLACALTAVTIRAESYTFTTYAGPSSASAPYLVDGIGSTARFQQPSDVAADANGNIYVAEVNTIRKISSDGTVSTLAGTFGQGGTTDGIGSAATLGSPGGIATDAAGNVYITDNMTIRKITPNGIVTTLAGVPGQRGSADGRGIAARFYFPSGIAVDASGNVYIADSQNETIRKMTPDGTVSTLAGMARQAGTADGLGTTARFTFPAGVTIDAGGNIYVADTGNFTVRKITPDGFVSTLAGQANNSGYRDGPAAVAEFGTVQGVSVDRSGNIYVADTSYNVIRKITPDGIVSTFAGAAAHIAVPSGITTDVNGNVYVADSLNKTVSKITPLGAITLLAGAPPSKSGSLDGPAPAAKFSSPRTVAVDGSGNVYVADTPNHTIRKVTPDGTVSTFAGSAGLTGSADGNGSSARFNNPYGVAVDVSGNVYVSDAYNSTVRKITPAGQVTTLAGIAGQPGNRDGGSSIAQFYEPFGLAVAKNNNVFVADTYNSTLRQITPSGFVDSYAQTMQSTGAPRTPQGVAADLNLYGYVYVAESNSSRIEKIYYGGTMVVTLAGTQNQTGSADGTGSAALFKNPQGIAIDSNGNLFVADTNNHTIRKITSTGQVTTIGGIAGQAGAVDGTGPAARFNSPTGIAVDANGTLYIADTSNNSIRKGVPTIADLATIDSPTGAVGAARQLDTSAQTATSWTWTLIRQPALSTATLSSTSIRNPTFVPDVADTYVFQLTASSAAGSSVSTVTLNATPAPTTTLASDLTALYSDSDQTLLLSATVSASGAVVNDGSVTFQINLGASQIGDSVTAPVVNGQVNASYLFPAGRRGSFYLAISATYVSPKNFKTSTDHKTLTLIGPPAAYYQSVDVPYTATAITLTGGDIAGPVLPLTYAVSTPPSHGSLSGTAPNLIYTPDTGYLGADSFQFTVANYAFTSFPGIVTLTVSAQTPTASDQTLNIPFNTPTTIMLTGSDFNVPALPLSYLLISHPTNGTLSGTPPNLTYTPADGFSGSDSFQFTVTNSANFTSNPASVSLTVPLGAPIAAAQNTNVPYNTATSITLVANDPNLPALPLTYSVTTDPVHGSLSGTAPNLTYTPTNNYYGPDTIQFTVTNTANLTSTPATVSLSIAADAPVASAQTLSIPLNTATPITLAGSDPNIPALSLIYTITTNPAHGTLGGSIPNIIYTPANGFNGSDSFQFTAVNAANITGSPATISLNVAPGAPTAFTQTVRVPLNTATSIRIKATDPNLPARPLTYSITSNPSQGTLSGSAPNLTYTPITNISGTDIFQFTVTNTANLTSAVATISIIIAANPPPTFASGPAMLPNPATAGQPVQFTAIATDVLTITYSWNFGDGTQATGSTVNHVFAPTGNYSVVVTATDPTNGVTTATILAQVNPVVGTPGGNATLLPGETDSDGDGFSDAVESAAGSNPNDPANTPITLGQSSTLQPPQKISKPVLKINTRKKTLRLTGSIRIPAGFTPTNKLLIANVGGYIQKFSLDSKAKSKLGKDTFQLSLKLKKKLVIDQSAKFALTLYNIPSTIVPTSEILLILDGLVFTKD